MTPADEEGELRRLLRERDQLVALLADHEKHLSYWRTGAWVVLAAFAVWFVFAARAGAIDWATLPWIVLLAFGLAFFLTREIRWQGKVVSVFEILGLLGGHWVVARPDVDELRRRLRECELRIQNFRP